MYKPADIKTNLVGATPLVGWRQNADPAGWQISTGTLETSSSGHWFNDQHPLVTFDNLVSVAPEFDRIDPAQAAINTAFTAWLRQRTEASVMKTIDAWIAMKMQQQTARNLLERSQLFESTGNIATLTTKGTGLVGIEIQPARSRSILLKVEAVGVQFSAVNDPIAIKLYRSGQKAQQQTQNVSYQAADVDSVKWTTVNWELEGEGAYYVLYDEDTLNGQAINGITDWTEIRPGIDTFPKGRFYRARAFRADVALGNLWDLNDNVYTIETNYGLNLRIRAVCDYTTLFTDQKDLFARAIALQGAIDALRTFAYNAEARVNRNIGNLKEIRRQDLLYEIDGDSQGRPGGLVKEFREILEAVSLDFSAVDAICLPCRRRSMSIGVIGL